MQRDLVELMTRLAQHGNDSRLAALEPLVWARIGAAQASRSGAALRWQAGIAGLALGLGSVVGGAATATPDPATLFSPVAALAPSTLLAGR